MGKGNKEVWVRFIGDSDPFYFIHGKIYKKIGESGSSWRVVDESGEDYLYGPGWFEVIDEKELKKLPKFRKHTCPVCGKGVFSMRDSFERCKVCGWTDGPEIWCNLGLTVEKCKELYQQGKLDANWEYVREMKKEENQGSHACPICWKTRFSKWDSQEMCSNCGWIDNWLQDKYEDKDGINKMCRRDYRKAYKQGTL